VCHSIGKASNMKLGWPKDDGRKWRVVRKSSRRWERKQRLRLRRRGGESIVRTFIRRSYILVNKQILTTKIAVIKKGSMECEGEKRLRGGSRLGLLDVERRAVREATEERPEKQRRQEREVRGMGVRWQRQVERELPGITTWQADISGGWELAGGEAPSAVGKGTPPEKRPVPTRGREDHRLTRTYIW
jgi:hypothetical protein